MNTHKPQTPARKSNRAYVKPEVRKHKSMVVVSGSGDSDCTMTKAAYVAGLMTYYH